MMKRDCEGARTLSEQFCDTYVRLGGRVSYILMPKLLTDRALAERMPSLLNQGRPVNLVEFEGVPAYQIRHKFRRSLYRNGNNPIGLYGALESLFKEEAIKKLFTMPNVWLLNHNEVARKRRATEESVRNRERKLNPEGYRLRAQCANRTRNMSVSAAAREERELANGEGIHA